MKRSGSCNVMSWWLAVAALSLSGCSYTASMSGIYAEQGRLGTRWGETLVSSVTDVAFERASAAPDSVTAIYYDDLRGMRYSGEVPRLNFKTLALEIPKQEVEIALIDGEQFWNMYLPAAKEKDKMYVIGERGKRYEIMIKNNSAERLEVVLSVDGLDVIDGGRANFDKRGYIVDPGKEFIVKGFRRSNDEVAAFRFADISQSYAEQKHGDSSNVGVIGCAIFAERDAEHSAKQVFATPPPGRETAEPFERKQNFTRLK